MHGSPSAFSLRPHWRRSIALPSTTSRSCCALPFSSPATLAGSASAFHAALNYTQYDFMGHAPSQPMAAYAPPPSGPVSDPDAVWARTLVDRPGALAQLEFAYRQSQVRDNRLGHALPLLLVDERVREPVRRLQSRLADIESQIEARNLDRLLPYPYLLPSRLTASIHI